MKKQIKILIMAGCMTLMGAAGAMAGPGHHGPMKTDQRIWQGFHSGELTRQEARILSHHQHQLQCARYAAWADGLLSRREKIHLDKLKHRLDHQIYRFKHNHATRW